MCFCTLDQKRTDIQLITEHTLVVLKSADDLKTVLLLTPIPSIKHGENQEHDGDENDVDCYC